MMVSRFSSNLFSKKGNENKIKNSPYNSFILFEIWSAISIFRFSRRVPSSGNRWACSDINKYRQRKRRPSSIRKITALYY